MGIYVKGMKMPRSCDECYIREKDTCPILKANLTGWGRRIDCPLVPVPDHGDLIDRNVLLSKVQKWYWEALETVKRMPTVIPAERSE